MKEKIEAFKNKYRLFSLSFREFIDRYIIYILLVVVTLLALLARYLSCIFPTNDLVGYILNGWMADIEQVGFKNFYTINSDYSPLYLFLLAIFTTFPKGELITVNGYTFYQNGMYYLKSIYFLMDVLSALGMFLIVHHVTKSKNKACIAYMAF